MYSIYFRNGAFNFSIRNLVFLQFLFGQKWLYLGKSGFIRAKQAVFGQSGCIRAKVFVFGQNWLYSGKVVVFGQSGCIRA